jgi:ribosomal protein S18 acetylase RimI-like enzyme
MGAVNQKVPRRYEQAPQISSQEMDPRPPKPSDAAALGAVHVRAWQAAYRGGLMPDDYLDLLSAEERAEMWSTALEQPPGPRRSRLVVEDASGTAIGFILVGPEEGDDDTPTGELYAINVDPDYWGTGAGRALHDAGVEALAEAGFDLAVLWVHPDNARARSFYESLGWQSDDVTRQAEVLGVEVPELRYSISL